MPDTPQKLHTPKRIDKTQPHSNKSDKRGSKTKLFSPSSTNSVESKANTPKVPPRNINDSYFSPISPLYEQANQSSINNFKQNSTEKQGMCLGDFLVSPKNSVKKKKKNLPPATQPETSKRIKPTNLNLNPSGIQNTQNSFNFETNKNDLSNEIGVAEQRITLAEERLKIANRAPEVPITNHSSLLKRQSSLNKADVKPLPTLVTYKANLKQVIDVYKALIKHHFVLNITSEIYFLISLVLSKYGGNGSETSNPDVSKDSLHNSEIFETVHNIVYFGVKSLESQLSELQFYDKTTIKLLADSERIKDFSPELSKKLTILAQDKAEKPATEIALPTSQTNVCFNIDTDNQQNFPDLHGFHAFRKQRDLFYEILRIWETQHLTPGWDFSQGLLGKIRSLFTFHNGPANLMHLSRLFKNQLLSSCSRGPRVSNAI